MLLTIIMIMKRLQSAGNFCSSKYTHISPSQLQYVMSETVDEKQNNTLLYIEKFNKCHFIATETRPEKNNIHVNSCFSWVEVDGKVMVNS